MVECDASIMQSVPFEKQTVEYENSGIASSSNSSSTKDTNALNFPKNRSWFGGVSNVTCVKNPIKVAAEILKQQKEGTLSFGRIRPIFLVGEGANVWAKNNGIEQIKPEDLITEKSRKTWEKYTRLINEQNNENNQNNQNSEKEHKGKKRLLDGENESSTTSPKQQKNHSEKNREESEEEESSLFQDTVGAICVDKNGVIVSAVSSGGILLKHSGRVGEAAMYGCGCWAEDFPSCGVGCSVSGTGEFISLDLLAKGCCDIIKDNEYPDLAVQNLFSKQFLPSNDTTPRNAGLIAIKKTPLPKTTKNNEKDNKENNKNESSSNESHENSDSENDDNDNLNTNNANTNITEENNENNNDTKNSVNNNVNHQFEIELIWGHNTSSMGIGYTSSNPNYKSRAIISRLPDKRDTTSPHFVLIEGINCKI
eukprot:TRINITY_DN844_c0_g1_i5.p1 TRINITY_DN844_c0_g1~~TRINITY_DN844_c0_g1_i5.p1  ORF type:complete len:424 (-),score=111.63 TRINITY_DN844_c0_g1_i5:21-1292(-)